MSRSLLESIESFVKPANMMWSIRMFKRRWLSHVDFLFQNTMKKRILDI
jgi:hypothetical protein